MQNVHKSSKRNFCVDGRYKRQCAKCLHLAHTDGILHNIFLKQTNWEVTFVLLLNFCFNCLINGQWLYYCGEVILIYCSYIILCDNRKFFLSLYPLSLIEVFKTTRAPQRPALWPVIYIFIAYGLDSKIAGVVNE